ncbi:hypothetical protein ACX8Z9_03875 [Arthrobacter halodurans]|uniref:DUF308 domain-containing protein n=1 Tax=Arthrobacter halodurans TaxID=516699 RepID=A0ABV4UJ09_9MICC
MPAPTTPADVAAALWKPVMFRAVAAAAFGALSVFWPAPDATVLAYAFAGYLVFSAKAVWDFAQAGVVPSAVRGLLGGAAIAWSLAAVFMVFVPEPGAVAVAGGVALAVSGLLELYAWLRHRAELVPVRDFLISGGASLGTGAALLAGRGLDPHGLFGIAGGGAIIVAVFLLIAAFGYRHDARERAERR